MENRTAFRSCILTVLAALILLMIPWAEGAGTRSTVLEDKKDDVIGDSTKLGIDNLDTLLSIDGTSQKDSAEKRATDILKFEVLQNDSYISFILTMDGDIRVRPEFSYNIGRTAAGVNTTAPFDFVISYTNLNGSYLTWKEGRFQKEGNISRVEISGYSINLTMHRRDLGMGAGEELGDVVGYVIMDPGGEKERLIDHVYGGKEDNDKGFVIDDFTLMMFQIVFFLSVFLVILLIYNYWARRKGMVEEGGVCPVCESRLDKSLDFCPSCGTYVRGKKRGSRREGSGPHVKEE